MGYPTWMYKLENGEVVSRIFDSDDIPKGWIDNCYALTEVDPVAVFDDKDELEAYAKEKYGVDIDKRKKLSTLIKEVQELGNG